MGNLRATTTKTIASTGTEPLRVTVTATISLTTIASTGMEGLTGTVTATIGSTITMAVLALVSLSLTTVASSLGVVRVAAE